MKDRIEKLLPLVSGDERVELIILNNGYIEATNNNKNDHSENSVQVFKRMKAGLLECLDLLEAKYIQEPVPVTAAAIPGQPLWETFTDTKVKFEVLTYLQQTGWVVKKQTFYNHVTAGKLRKNRGGLYTTLAVKKYAETWLVHAGLGMTVDESVENLAKEKLVVEIEGKKTTNEHAKLKLAADQSRYIPRAEVELELASRAAMLDAGMEYAYKTGLAEMVAVVGGDQNKAPLLLDMLLKRRDALLGAYANFADFIVVFQE